MIRYILLFCVLLGLCSAEAVPVAVHEYTVTNGVFAGDVEFPAVFRGSLNWKDVPEGKHAVATIIVNGEIPDKLNYSCNKRDVTIGASEIDPRRSYEFTLNFGYPEWVSLDYEFVVGYEMVHTLFSVDYGMGWFSGPRQQATRNYWVGFAYGSYPHFSSGLPTVSKRFSNSEFVGWSTGTNGAGVVVTGETLADSSYTNLYAKWRYNYSVRYHSGYLPEETSIQTMVNDQHLPLAGNTFVRSGYRFVGWAEAPEGAVVWTNRQEVINLCGYPGTNDLYAVWEDRRYTVEYDANGGLGVMEPQLIGLDEQVALDANAFARIGWDFLGWASNRTAMVQTYTDGQLVSNLIDVAGMTSRLYAVWKPMAELDHTIFTNRTSGIATHMLTPNGESWADVPVRVAVDPNGGVRQGVVLSVVSNGVTIAGTSDLPSRELLVTFRTGCTYELKVDASSVGADYAYVVTVNRPGLDVVYDVGNVGEASGGTNYNFTVGSPYGCSPTPVRKGFAFEGWQDRKGKIVTGDDIVALGVSETLTAKWSGSFPYELSFDKSAADATGKMDPVACIYGEPSMLPACGFSRTGYTFKDWLDEISGTRYGDKATVSNLTEFAESNAVLKAEWSAITYIVRFNATSGVYGSIADLRVEYDRSVALSPNSFIRAGYHFVGWSEVSGGPVQWTDGAVVSNLCTTANDVKNLYPVWEKLTGVEVYSGKSDYGVVTMSDGQAALFVNSGTNFTAVVSSPGAYRVSLDPQEGVRVKATVTVSELQLDGQYHQVLTVSDLAAQSTSYEFKSGTTYRFTISGNGKNESYAVGLGLEGVQVRYHGLAGTIADSDRTFNLTSDFPYGFLPSFTVSPGDYHFAGWYDKSFWRHGAMVETNSVVSVARIDVYAGWKEYEVPALLILDYADSECGRRQVTTNEFAVGFAINDLLPMPICDNHSCVGWLETSTGKWWTDSDLMPTNGLALTAQWNGEYRLVEVGLEGWMIAGYRGKVSGELFIPEVLGSRRVVAIGEGAFAGQTNMTGVIFRVTEPDADGENGFCFLEDDITIGTAAFSNCTALTHFELPLGVRSLPDELFAGCTSLTNSFIGIPYTVTTIGNAVFKGCTALVGMTIPELVTEMGDEVFMDCSSLKVVRYLGSSAPTVGDNIYYHAKSDLVSGYLAVRAWDTVPEWTTNYYRTCVSLQSSFYKTSKVTLHYNDGKTADRELVYIRGRVFGLLLSEDEEYFPDDEEEEEEEEESLATRELEFKGWYTAKVDGNPVGMYQVISGAADVYAHWIGYTERSESETSFGNPFYSDDDEDNGDYAFNAAVFDGYLMDGDALAGTFTIKASKGKYDATAEGKTAAIKVTITIAGLKKVTLSGTIDPDGHAYAEGAKGSRVFEANLSRLGVTDATYTCDEGSYGDGQGARDRYSASYATEAVSAAMRLCKGTWSVMVMDENGCWSVLSVVVGNKGKTKVSGTLADGTKVSTSAVAIVGDGCCCVPVVYSKKDCQFAFAIWFNWSDDGDALGELTGLNGFADGRFSRVPPALVGECTLLVDGSFDFGDATASVDDPSDAVITASGTKWKLPKADKWKFVKDEGWEKSTEYGNETGLKLTYTAKNGQFKGSYRIYAVTDSGKSRKYTVTVTGGMADEDGVAVGYGSARIKNVGSLPVTIE